MGDTELNNFPSNGTALNGNYEPSSNKTKSAEPNPEKSLGFRSILSYPIGVYFYLLNSFLQTYSDSGIDAVLVIFLMTVHGLSATRAKLVYHSFDFVMDFAPIAGAILADGFFGRYRVILFVSIFCCFGHLLLTSGALVSFHLVATKILTFVGLYSIAIALGSISPCGTAFGADQFPPHMKSEQTQFFSVAYFVQNVATLLSTIITPIMRYQPCMDRDTCFPLGFGIPAIFMLLATVTFWSGTHWYKMSRVKDNFIRDVFGCVVCALKRKFRKNGEKKNHWLDYAYPKYDQSIINDIKALFDILFLYSPVVLFFALFLQIWSTWIVQASQMNGRIGRLTILPDQMSALNPILIIIMIPIFEALIYPFLAKFHILTRPLRRMGWGGVLVVTSFTMAGLLQLSIDRTAIKMPASGHVRLSIINFLQCDVHFTDDRENFSVASNSSTVYDVSPKISLSTNDSTLCPFGNKNLSIDPLEVASFLSLSRNGSDISVHLVPYELAKTADGMTRIYVVFEPRQQLDYNLSVTIDSEKDMEETVDYTDFITENSYVDIQPSLYGSNKYTIFIKKCDKANNCSKEHLKAVEAVSGAAHMIIVPAQNEKEAKFEEIIEANSVSILWQVPQYVVITIGELLFYISGMSFSYVQASPRMKSLFQSIWLLTAAFGNLIDMGMSGSGLFEEKAALEFFSYGGVMGVVMILFVVLAWRYNDKSQ